MISSIKSTIRYAILSHCPRVLLGMQYRKALGREVNWKHPRDLNEKILWLLVNSDTAEWTRLSDKVKVREYVVEKGLSDLLVPLYGVWKSSTEIDFEALPEQFVLKCNHDSGSFLLVDKNREFDKSKICDKMDHYLKRDMGNYGEMHYSKIKPRMILAEQMLRKQDEKSSSMVDYKVWCFDGKPFCIMTVSERQGSKVNLDIFDKFWVSHPEWLVFSNHYQNGEGKIVRPASLEKMLEAASILSEGHPQVRIDFYDVEGKLYFGEMTFTSLRGMMTYYTQEVLNRMGDMVDLSKAKKK